MFSYDTQVVEDFFKKFALQKLIDFQKSTKKESKINLCIFK